MIRPLIMGVLNVTPDSFSDGGQYSSVKAAVDRAHHMVDEGADWIDIGGESTRPGATPVEEEEELRRVIPVIERLKDLQISIDTMKPEVARQASLAGAKMVNDVSGLRDQQMRELCVQTKCQVVIMHMRGTPATMQNSPQYADVVEEVKSYLLTQAEGLDRDNVWLDPGIGFGKSDPDNLLLLENIDKFAQTGYRVLVGASRKGFLSRVYGAPADDRVAVSVKVHVQAVALGASMVRVHDVAAHRIAFAQLT